MDETTVAGLCICWAGKVMLHHRVIVRTKCKLGVRTNNRKVGDVYGIVDLLTGECLSACM